ncbi:hypothetical protein [Rhodococcus sp. BP22]|uniref:hypothetical protein n=1 Tax=Rhodococcus sp. BP22 TaxID=2758566 RepID=UPI00164798BE|nr:hypothetical protein [Rhodococcus sp. BP22]
MTITPTLRETLSWILITLATVELALAAALPNAIALDGTLATAGRLLLAVLVGFSVSLVAIVAFARVAAPTPDPLGARRD